MTSVDAFLRFIECRGARVLFSILEDLNAGLPQRTIAQKWDMDEATLSRHIHRHYCHAWQLNRETAMLLDAYNQSVGRRLIQHQAAILPIRADADG